MVYSLTAAEAIASEPKLTCTVEAANVIAAIGISATVVFTSGTLIDICSKSQTYRTYTQYKL